MAARTWTGDRGFDGLRFALVIALEGRKKVVVWMLLVLVGSTRGLYEDDVAKKEVALALK